MQFVQGVSKWPEDGEHESRGAEPYVGFGLVKFQAKLLEGLSETDR